MLSTTIIVLSRQLFTRALRSTTGDSSVRSLSNRLRRYAALVSAVSSAAAEGLRKAQEYRTLTHNRDAERGLSRAELLRLIMFVKH